MMQKMRRFEAKSEGARSTRLRSELADSWHIANTEPIRGTDAFKTSATLNQFVGADAVS